MADIKKQYREIKTLLGGGRNLQLTDEDALRNQDVLLLLEERGYLLNLNVDGANCYRRMADFSGFEEWLKQEAREAKRLTRREWTISIVSAVIGAVLGAVIGLIP